MIAAGGKHDASAARDCRGHVRAGGRRACPVLSRAADHADQPVCRRRPCRPARARRRRGDERDTRPRGRRRQPPRCGHRHRCARSGAGQARRLHAFYRRLAVTRDHAGADEGRGLRRHRVVYADRHRRRRSQRPGRAAEPSLQERGGGRRRRPQRGRQHDIRHGRGRAAFRSFSACCCSCAPT